MTLKPREQDLHAPYRSEMLRIHADHPGMVRELARAQGCSERAVYRVLEGEVAARVWVPGLLADLYGVRAFAAASGASARGYVVVAPPDPGEVSGRDLAMAALQLGPSVLDVQRLVMAAVAPESTGGERIVGSEEVAIRQAIGELRRAAVSLERLLGEHAGPPVREVSRR